jgi:hypothetical protein
MIEIGQGEPFCRRLFVLGVVPVLIGVSIPD